MDFAENFSCRYQDEIRTAFWDTNQVTLHPMMSYYLKDKDKDGNVNLLMFNVQWQIFHAYSGRKQVKQ